MTKLFAALNVVEGKVIGQCMNRHRHQAIAWQSVIDSTAGAGGVFDSVFGRLAGQQHELVLFDVNRLAVFRSLETCSGRWGRHSFCRTFSVDRD